MTSGAQKMMSDRDGRSSESVRPPESITRHWLKAKLLSELTSGSCSVVHLEGHTLALVRDGERVFAVDNRCPHMGFPLNRGSVSDGILTCHWHHARFDL